MAIDRTKIQQNADKLVKQGKIDQAISLYEQLLEDSPRDMNLKNKVGDLLVRAGSVPGAVKVFTQVADFYAEEGFYLKAIAVCKKINRLDPSSVGCYYKLADLYAKQGLNNDAKSQYQQLSEIFAKDGDTGKSAEALEHLVKIDPENLMVRYRLIELYTGLSQTGKAIREYHVIGGELAKKSKHEDAVKVFEKGLALDGASPELIAGLCTSLLELNRNRELIDRAKAAYVKNRENVPMLAVLSEAYLRTGETELARQVIEKLVAIEPENERWKERLSEAKSGKPAVPVAVASAPASRAANADLPDFSEMTGDYSMEELGEASGEWATAEGAPEPASGDPAGAPEGRTGLEADREEFILEHMTEAEVFIKYGLVEKAIDNLEAIVSHYPDEVESLRRLKDLYLETGNKKMAAERAVDLARLARAKGDMQKALDLLAEARAHDPQVRLERTTAAAVEEPSSSDVYSFGSSSEGGPVELDSAPADSGVELDFNLSEPAAPAAARSEGSYEVPASGTSLEFGEGGSAKPDTIEFTLDENAPGEAADAIEIDLDEGEESPAAAGGAEPEEGELAEADFYAEQGFTDEARVRIEALRKRFPGSRKVRERLERLGRAAASATSGEVALEPGAAGEEGIEFFDSAIRAPRRDAAPSSPAPFGDAEPLGGVEDTDTSLFEQETEFLADAAESPAAASPAAGSGVGEDSLEEIFREFKKGVEAQFDDEDYETHYNLGIAYREMELTDEAIAEFQLASKDPNRFVDCCSNLGQCFLEKGMPKLAVKWYAKALESLEMGTPQSIAILYVMGEAYEQAGDKEKALETYTDVYGLDANYRDVSDKIRKLEE